MDQRRTIASALLIALGSPGCTEFGPRVYTAQPYRAAQACVGTSVALGLVQAEELESTCAPVCLLLDETLYVSVVCAPYPTRASPTQPKDSADCARALALFESQSRCDAADAEAPDAAEAGAADSAAPPL